MDLIVKPSSLSGEIRVPGSKSHTIRALVIASLADGRSRIEAPLVSDDTCSCVHGCTALGARIELQDDCFVVDGFGGEPEPTRDLIDIGNSGTSLRFLTSVAALGKSPVSFDGDESIRKRPMQSLLDALSDLGAETRSLKGDGYCPIRVKGPIKGGRTSVDGITSQYISSLLIATPLAPEDTTIEVRNLRELPYVRMTLSWLTREGIIYSEEGMQIFRIKGSQRYVPFNARIPGDFSSATFPLCAAAITGSDLTIKGLDINDTQGDRGVIEILRSMGAEITVLADGVRVKGGELEGIEIDLSDMPDALPALAVVGAVAKGRTIIKNAYQARIKESDRIAVMREELSKMGADIKECEDGLIIEGGRLKGTRVDGHRDHRVVMALSIAGLIAEGETIISGAEFVGITFPDYVELMREVGARMEVKKG
ncbi:MAG TPA: 3-phosphoshikimate 1-carboxyvinyltransferase [Candidatus Syntrophoarchaeum butanivorans]|uniref:3-phosphoshikimate 1-carboxyvinyltransferase n=1 Tax=Candidatus Syntropharchaeum butanivorans TaxID=1839936 RepID=A0A7C0X231_9EURY|nr:3-phosphoshikimate 1-carboxyvinyltransferase [Candidatus Syntrophoarchaeum butanivorans]